MSTNDIDDYISFKILEYRHFELIDDDLQEQYQEDFADFTETIFKAYNFVIIHNL